MSDGARHHGGAAVATITGYTRLGARARSELDRYAAVKRVIAAMHERTDRPFALDEMARIAYLSPFYFNRVFRQITGVPPRRFHTALRIATAKRLLLTTNLSVTEVCLEVGYQSLGTFTTCFHQLVGVSPRELRRLAAEPTRAAVDVAKAIAQLQDDSVPPAIEGTVTDIGDDHLVFIGLFRRPYAQGLPIACTARAGPGPYALRTTEREHMHVAAAAFAPSDGIPPLHRQESALVASVNTSVSLTANRPATRDLCLRSVRSTDPPILLALPLNPGVVTERVAVRARRLLGAVSA